MLPFRSRVLFRPHAVAFLLSLLLVGPGVQAHDYWFDPAGDDYLLYRGHRFSQHGGERDVPFDPAIVTAALCLKAHDSEPRPAATAAGYPLRIAGPCLAVMAVADSGYWSQTLTGTRNQPKDKAFGALRSWQALESVKRVEAWHERLRAPLSTELELVFLDSPFALSTGDKLRLVAMLGGKPVKGVTVAYDGEPRGVTGGDGRVNLRVRHRGLQAVSASIEEPLASPKADKRVRSTILLFELK